jgi:branched-chain amino acid transport system permease protein
MSGEVVLMTLLGGMGTVFGPIAGAVLVVGLQNYSADLGEWLKVITGGIISVDLGEWVPVITGGIFVVCVLLFRRGIVGEIQALFSKPR